MLSARLELEDDILRECDETRCVTNDLAKAVTRRPGFLVPPERIWHVLSDMLHQCNIALLWVLATLPISLANTEIRNIDAKLQHGINVAIAPLASAWWYVRLS